MQTELTTPAGEARLDPEVRLTPEEIHRFDLRATLETLRNETQYAANGRNGITLVKNAEVRVVLEALQPGARLAEHQAPGPITVQVLEGEILFTVDETTYTLLSGELLVVPARKRHSVRATRASAFLLTIAPQAE